MVSVPGMRAPLEHRAAKFVPAVALMSFYGDDWGPRCRDGRRRRWQLASNGSSAMASQWAPKQFELAIRRL
jgi:hypothetical protein